MTEVNKKTYNITLALLRKINLNWGQRSNAIPFSGDHKLKYYFYD